MLLLHVIVRLMDFRALLERSAFGVCSYIGEKAGIAAGRVRVYFIYLSFVTMGSSLILYLFVWFWLNLRPYVRRGALHLHD